MADKKMFNFDPLEALADIVTGDFLDFGGDKKGEGNGNSKHVGGASGDDAESVSGGADKGGGEERKRKRSADEQLGDTFKPAGKSKEAGQASGQQEQSKPEDKKGAAD
jgi:hypothetical protein